jgi:hypothetical protein
MEFLQENDYLETHICDCIPILYMFYISTPYTKSKKKNLVILWISAENGMHTEDQTNKQYTRSISCEMGRLTCCSMKEH